MIVNQDWLVRNAQRKYPIEDAASAVSDGGAYLPEDVIVDMNVWTPEFELTEGTVQFLYISSVIITEHLVSLTILGASAATISPGTAYHPGPGSPFTPIAALTIEKPVIPYKNYPLDAFQTGVMGWVAFGGGVNREEFSMLFSNPTQSLLVPKAARFYTTPAVTGISSSSGFTTAAGDVLVQVDPPFTTEIRNVTYNGETREALIIGLEQSVDVMEAFAGPCGKRPESGSCGKDPILSIAGVTPDCSGNIVINVDGAGIRLSDAGFCLDSDIELSATCDQTSVLPDSNGILPNEYEWSRPCDQTTPYSADLTDVASARDSEFRMYGGYWAFDSGVVSISSGGYSTVSAGSCFASYEDDITTRTFSATFEDIEDDDEIGMVICEAINTRVYMLGKIGGTVEVIKENMAKDDETVVASGTYSSGDSPTVSVAVSDQSATFTGPGFSYTLNFTSGEVYWEPSGRAGLLVGDGTIKLNAFTVTDV
jgi:hypothetical protein